MPENHSTVSIVTRQPITRTRIAFRDLVAGALSLMFGLFAIALVPVIALGGLDGRFGLASALSALLSMYFLNKVGTGPLIMKERKS